MDISILLNGLAKILGPISTLSKDRRELKDSALRAILNALNETYLYYRDLDRGLERNPEREELLVKYWSAAAIPMRHFDRDLAEKCNIKSDYWLSPELYDDAKITELGIGLDNVRQAYRKMTGPIFSVSRKFK
ncbi:hypothetical protein [Maribacter arenosus]|uniref:Uncharacterized protein n=1 Tax=Maribacter arenosus TaxID=1854708 RepID=A0ABR7VHQ7_9FLAO|nr:hypothetical protein [Maribacter arenosus]MBD0851953.1 hypothetical protein [Maribacter arenosus]